jgi:hypothetical protein
MRHAHEGRPARLPMAKKSTGSGLSNAGSCESSRCLRHAFHRPFHGLQTLIEGHWYWVAPWRAHAGQEGDSNGAIPSAWGVVGNLSTCSRRAGDGSTAVQPPTGARALANSAVDSCSCLSDAMCIAVWLLPQRAVLHLRTLRTGGRDLGSSSSGRDNIASPIAISAWGNFSW